MYKLRLFFCLLFIVKGLFLEAQPGALDLSFNPGTGANGIINDLALQPDGKCIAVGDFISFNGLSVSKVIRLNTNGSIDTSFHANNYIHGDLMRAVAIQQDEKIIVGGDIVDYNGISSPSIVRLNKNGSYDSTFHIGTGFNNVVHTIAIQSDNKILVGGKFTAYNGAGLGRICRLNTDGSLDTSFHCYQGTESTVEDIVIRPDGKIVIAGNFHEYNNTTNVIRAALINPDGTVDSSFSSYPGASKVIYDIEYLDSNKIVAVGNFDTYDFQNKNRIVQLNKNGGIDVLLNMGTGPNFELHAVKVANKHIFIGGDHTTYNGFSTNRFTRLNADGQFDATFQTGLGADGLINTIKVQKDGKILIAGALYNYNGIARKGIARVYNCLTTQPGSISGKDSTECSGTLTYAIAPIAGATKYEWILPTGWSGSSESTSITALSNGKGGVISVKAFSDSCGYSMAETKTIYGIQPPTVSICLVTVDSISTHNIVVWEKPITTLIDSIFIYRETASNIYTKIGSVPYDSIGQYHDFGADPNMTSYRYKISSLSKCGVESSKSLYHTTIHLQELGNGNFIWTFYQIEGTLNPVLAFNFYRDIQLNGKFSPIGNVPGTNATFTDITYTSFPNADYVVDVDWNISCIPAANTYAVNTTRSNIKKTRKATGIYDDAVENSLFYPNPADQVVYLSVPTSYIITQVQIMNSLGQVIATEIVEPNSGSIKKIDIAQLPKGMYVITAFTSSGKVNKKLIVE